MAGSAFGLPQLASLYDPSIAVDQAALDRQMQLAQTLRAMSLHSVGATQMAGNVAIRNSPLAGVAQVVQALRANQMDQANDQARLALNAHMMQALAGSLRDGDQSSAPQQAPAPVSDLSTPADAPENNGLPAGVSATALAAGGFPQPAPTSAAAPTASAPAPAASMPSVPSSNAINLASLLRGATVQAIGGDPAAAAYWDRYKIPDSVKTLYLTGQNPQDVGDLTTGKLRKEANAPTRLGPNAYADASGQIHYIPSTIPGSVNLPDPTNPSGFQTVPVPGSAGAIQSNAQATAVGKTFGQTYNGVDASGQPKPVTSVANVLGYGNTGPVTPQQQGARDDQRMQILLGERQRLAAAGQTDPALEQEIADMQRRGFGASPASAGATYGAAPLGAVTEADSAAKNRQQVMKDDYANLSAQNATAQTVISRLQTIKQLGPQAITGAEADTRDFLNGILTLAHYKPAIDAKTASDLIDKNAAQIALAIGAGSNGTDALRTLAQVANPGRHMQLEAIAPAANSIIAPLQMGQAKTQLLTQPFVKGDADTYLNMKTKFEKAADPRLWELANLSPDQQKAYVGSLTPADAKQLLQGRATLRQLGIFQ